MAGSRRGISAVPSVGGAGDEPEMTGVGGEAGLANVKNAFEPWDTGERLAPERHPLRGFDGALKPDPWLGDSWGNKR